MGLFHMKVPLWKQLERVYHMLEAEILLLHVGEGPEEELELLLLHVGEGSQLRHKKIYMQKNMNQGEVQYWVQGVQLEKGSHVKALRIWKMDRKMEAHRITDGCSNHQLQDLFSFFSKFVG